MAHALRTERGTVCRVAHQPGYRVESIRSWARQPNVDVGHAPRACQSFGVSDCVASDLGALEEAIARALRAFSPGGFLETEPQLLPPGKTLLKFFCCR